MAQRSILWPTTGLGDGLVGGYPDDDLILVNRMKWTNDPTEQGVARGYLNELEVLETIALTLEMDTGGAIVYGFPYWNTTPLSDALILPVINTTGWRWVLRVTWAAQIVRAILTQSADGVAAPPALVQNPGVTYEIGLAYGTVTVGGVITVNDDRDYLEPGIVIDNDHMANRQRSELIQAIQATSAGVVLVRSLAPGWTCADAVTTKCYGNFRMPDDADLTQPFLIVPVWTRGVGGAAGDIDITTTASFGNNGEDWNTHILTTPIVRATAAAVIIVVAAGTAVDIQPQADNNDFVSLYFERDGGAGGDTATCDLIFMGWLLEYTRDH